MLVVALSLSEQVEKIGAYAGIAAFFGFAVLAILCFAQAREIKRLRDWAGRAPERAAELEARVMADAAIRGRAPVPAATAAAAPVAAPAPANGGAAPQPAPAAAGDGDGAAAAKPADAGSEAPGADAPATAAPAAAEGAPSAAAPSSTSAPVTAAPAATPPATPAPPTAPGGPGRPANGTGTAGEVPPFPRATPPPRPGGASPPPRPRPGAAPLRAGGPPSRRPAGAPAARASTPPEQQSRSGARLAALIAGGVVGLAAIAFAASQILAGEKDAPPPNLPAGQATQEAGGSAGDETPDTAASTPSRADTTVAVLNGTTTNGLAKVTADKVVGAGFKQGTVGDYADQARAASLIFYTENARRQALEVAKLLGISPTAVEPVGVNDNPAEGADVVVVVGSDQTQ